MRCSELGQLTRSVDLGVQTAKTRMVREAAKTHEPITLLKDSLFKHGGDERGNIVIG